MVICKLSGYNQPHILYIKLIYNFLSILIFTWYYEPNQLIYCAMKDKTNETITKK